MKTKGICEVHGIELVETHPGDAENGPCPDDCLNELVCSECDYAELIAYETSVCLPHRSSLGACLPCFYDGEPIEMADGGYRS